jgi:hypothetical protein
VTLTPDLPLPGDSEWALAHDAAKIEPGETWFRKMNFLRGVAGPELMAITSTQGANTITLHHPRAGEITFDPATPEGEARLLAWIAPLWPENRPKPHRLIRTGQAMTDNPTPWISILSLESLRHLQGQMGIDLDVRRFRGNLWIDGLPAWSEFDLIGRDIQIGETRLRVDERIERCRATCVDPATGQESGEVLDALDTHYGHRDFGIFATVLTGGTIQPGDRISA